MRESTPGPGSPAPPFTSAELTARAENLQRAISDRGLDGALLLQRADLIYYTGSVFQGALLLPVTGETRLFVWRGQGRVGLECPWPLTPVKGLGHLAGVLRESAPPGWRRIGFEEDTVPVGWWRLLGPGIWPQAETVDIGPLIRSQRSVKSAAELDRVRRSGKALTAGFEALPDLIRAGLPEYEIQARMDVVMRQAGDQAGGRIRGFNAEARGVVACGASAAADIAFDGPIAQPGRNPLAPMGSGSAPIVPGRPIIVDHTAGVDGYMTDMTRTFHLGRLEERFIEAHALCVGILEETLREMVPGAVPSDLYDRAVARAEAAGFGVVFMNRGPNRVRFLGHGVGLEMDEWPVLARPFTDPLQEGQVLAVEPKCIFDDGGVGVEETVIVRPGGAEVVTPMERGLIRLD